MMTTEEYLLKRIQKLEQQVKDLIESKEVRFVFETRDMPKHIYKVEFEDGNIKISKENYEREVKVND